MRHARLRDALSRCPTGRRQRSRVLIREISVDVRLLPTSVVLGLLLVMTAACGDRSGMSSTRTTGPQEQGSSATTQGQTSSPSPESPTTSVIPTSWPMSPGSAVPAPALYVVSFPTESSGYAIAGGYQSYNGALAMQLATTTDAGTSWRAAGSVLPDANKTLFAGGNVTPHLAFASQSLGYNWDQQEIDVTADGGAHWQVLPDPPYMTGPYRIGPVALVGSSLWVTYAGFAPGLSPFGDVASWTPGVGWVKRLNEDVVIHAMTSTSSAVELLASPTEQPNSTSESFMYESAGGTGGWHTSGTLTCPTDSSVVDSLAGTGRTFLAECVGSFQAGWAARSYWLSTDDGATWAMRARDAAQANLKKGEPPFGEGGSVTHEGGRFWVAVTRSTLYSSRDYGFTWQSAGGLNSEASAFSGAVTFNGQEGWCAYFGLGLWRTTDGGSAWEELGQSGTG